MQPQKEMEQMEQDLVSVIMPTYNTGKFLSASIDSVLQQTYSNLELLITDDGSTDNTPSILEDYAKKDARVKVFYLGGNQGAGPARNNSLKHAQGRFIAFCDGDDLWLPDKLKKQIAFMRKQHCLITYSSYYICDEQDNDCGIYIAPRIVTYHGMLRDDKIGFLTAIYDVQEEGYKFYFPALKRRQDWAMLIALLKQYRVAYGMKEPQGIYRIRKGSISRNKLYLVKYNTQVYQEVLGFSKLQSYAFFACFFMPTYFFKLIKKHFNSFLYLKGFYPQYKRKT